MDGDTNTPDEMIGKLLRSARTIAVVGIKDRPAEDAFRVPEYMQANGYRIVPVNPKFKTVLNEPCHADLTEIGDRLEVAIDIVNLFRASEHIPGHIDEILALDPPPTAVWMQLGIHHGPSAQRLREAGIEVIQDRCIMVDHRNLVTDVQPVTDARPASGAQQAGGAHTVDDAK
jgi:predicted CoA-binding protein